MTSKEALADLIKRNEYFKENGVHIGTKTMDKIRELVERDTPKKVIERGNIRVIGLFCPKCLIMVDVDFNGCPFCLQRLDLSE